MLDTVAQVFGDPAVYAEVEQGLDEGRMPLRAVITREFAPCARRSRTWSYGSCRASAFGRGCASWWALVEELAGGSSSCRAASRS